MYFGGGRGLRNNQSLVDGLISPFSLFVGDFVMAGKPQRRAVALQLQSFVKNGRLGQLIYGSPRAAVMGHRIPKKSRVLDSPSQSLDSYPS